MNIVWEALMWGAVGWAAFTIPAAVRHLLWERRFRRMVAQDELLNPGKESNR